MPNMGYFRTVGTRAIGNSGKATVKVRYTYFFSLIFRYFLQWWSRVFQFSEIPRYNYDLSPSIKFMKFCQLVHFSKF